MCEREIQRKRKKYWKQTKELTTNPNWILYYHKQQQQAAIVTTKTTIRTTTQAVFNAPLHAMLEKQQQAENKYEHK